MARWGSARIPFESRYGYLEVAGSRVLRFVEKPPAEQAAEFVRSGRFLWNAGIFCFRVDVFLGELAAHVPDLLAGVEEVVAHTLGFGDRADAVTLDHERFTRLPGISIDHALMEHSKKIAVVPTDFGWNDIGSWSALVGVRDLVVVDSEGALLVVHRERVDEVQTVVSDLRMAGHESAERHREVHRPWGSYTVLEEGPRYKIKHLHVKPHSALSLQMHHHRSEHWVVVAGTAEVEQDGQKRLLHIDESTYIPAGTRHRLSNPGLVDLVLIEVQSGEYLGEDDIVRFEDDFGRV